MKYPCLLTKKINEISSAKYNPRKITDEAMGRLTKSLAEFGNIQPITWNVRTGNVVGGHQRLKVYKAMGKTEVEVWAVDLDEQKEKAANIALNKLSGEFDMPMLKDILEEIDTGDLDMEITGFGMDEIALMMEDAHPEVTEDEVPEVPVDAITKPGDLWILGEHRVLCGDSTKEDDIKKLMDGEKADMVFTDPPYGVTNIEWDRKLTQKDLDTFLSISNGPVCVWNATRPDIFKHMLSLTPMCERIAVWRMTSGITGKGGMFWTWQPIFVWRAREIKLWDSVEFESDSPTRTGDHPTQKPVKLICKWIEACDNKSIADPFCGSGTTLIAAEQLGRKCYGMEISPNYCDVIVKRWENLTGKKATLAK